jgi:hypothetical protein
MSTTSPTTLDEFDSFEMAVLDGFASLIAGNADARVPLWYEYDPSVPAPDGVLPITIDRYPQGEDASVTLSEYTVDDDVSLSDSTVGIQVAIWSRDRRQVKAITSDLFDLLHGRTHGMLGVVTLVMARRSSGTNVGQDSNERQGRTENYYVAVHRPSPNRT